MIRFAAGLILGFAMAAASAPWASRPHDPTKTMECMVIKPWLMGKRYACTPAEYEALKRERDGMK